MKLTKDLISKIYRNETTGKWMSPFKDEYTKICKNLKEGKMFSFARYGDGEFNAVFGKKGQNCDGHQYFPDMGAKLKEILETRPKYMMGIQPLALTIMEQDKLDWLMGLKINWVDSDVLHNANIEGTLDKFLYALKGKKILMVAPDHLGAYKDLKFVHLRIPEKDCWLNYTKIVMAIEERIDKFDVILYCASMMTECLINRFAGRITQIDCGSIFDPYVGKMSRSYHRKLDL